MISYVEPNHILYVIIAHYTITDRKLTSAQTKASVALRCIAGIMKKAMKAAAMKAATRAPRSPLCRTFLKTIDKGDKKRTHIKKHMVESMKADKK